MYIHYSISQEVEGKGSLYHLSPILGSRRAFQTVHVECVFYKAAVVFERQSEIQLELTGVITCCSHDK